MSIDVLHEDLIDLSTACREPVFKNKNGNPIHVSQLHRWVTTGARAVNGDRVRLEVVKTPAGRKTSREAIARFIHRLSDPDLPVPTSRQRKKEQADAEAGLVAAGFEVGGETGK
jgi:hypothetical protein